MATRKLFGAATVAFGVLALVTGCSKITEVSTASLMDVVQRDAVPFTMPSVPEPVVSRLSTHKVIVVGETHLIREHREFMAELIRRLHARGFRQLLLEWPHFADWLLRDFSEDRQVHPRWKPPMWFLGDLITAVRDFNRTLPAAQRVTVRGIDVNLDDYGGANDFVASLNALSQHLSPRNLLDEFLRAGVAPRNQYTNRLQALREQLARRRTELLEAWSAYWYATVSEMVDIELISVEIRAVRDDHYDLSVRLRENAMKWLADARLDGYGHRTIMNVGGNHAQKRYLKGTNQEWLGDYLVHKSDAVGGTVLVVAVLPARITSDGSATTPDFDLEASPENGLFRLMHQMWPDQIVFLPLDDPLFSAMGVPMNYEGKIFVAAPKRYYDAFVLLPLTHRIPLP